MSGPVVLVLLDERPDGELTVDDSIRERVAVGPLGVLKNEQNPRVGRPGLGVVGRRQECVGVHRTLLAIRCEQCFQHAVDLRLGHRL
jgi:hypothetical protein